MSNPSSVVARRRMLVIGAAAAGVAGLTATRDEDVVVQPPEPGAGPRHTPTHPETFPLAAAPGGHHLVQSDGRPFPVLVRSLWCIGSLGQAGYEALIDDTAARGFTGIEFFLHHFQAGGRAPFAGNDQAPFTRTLSQAAWRGALKYADIRQEAPDFTHPNPLYWQHIDAIMAYAESRNLLVPFFPAYVGVTLGYDGWRAEMVANGPRRMQLYGAWVADRYKSQANIVWMLGGDFGLGEGYEFSAVERAAELALIEGMLSVPAQRSTLYSNEWHGDSIGTDHLDFGRYISLNGCYSWKGKTASVARKGYAHTPPMPAFLQEGPYDEEGPDGNGFNPSATQPVRRFSWWAWLGSIGGYTFGNGFVWPMNAGYAAHLNTKQTRHHTTLNAFIRSLPWWTLVPDGLGPVGKLVVAGGGEIDAPNYVAAAADAQGTLVVAYLGPGHQGSVAIDTGRMRGPISARWFDPTDGRYVVAGLFAAGGARTFEPPGLNGDGEGDWVLQLSG